MITKLSSGFLPSVIHGEWCVRCVTISVTIVPFTFGEQGLYAYVQLGLEITYGLFPFLDSGHRFLYYAGTMGKGSQS